MGCAGVYAGARRKPSEEGGGGEGDCARRSFFHPCFDGIFNVVVRFCIAVLQKQEVAYNVELHHNYRNGTHLKVHENLHGRRRL